MAGGAVHVEILADVSFRVTSLTDRDAAEMVQSIRGYRLLHGYRGHPPINIEDFEEALLRLSRLVEELPEISEVDMNPVIAPGACGRHHGRIDDARLSAEANPELPMVIWLLCNPVLPKEPALDDLRQ